MGAMKSMRFWRNAYGRVDDLPSVVDERDELGTVRALFVWIPVSLVLWVSIIWGVWEILS